MRYQSKSRHWQPVSAADFSLSSTQRMESAPCSAFVRKYRRLFRSEEFLPGRIADGEHRGMLQFSLGTDGIKLRSDLAGRADYLQPLVLLNLTSPTEGNGNTPVPVSPNARSNA